MDMRLKIVGIASLVALSFWAPGSRVQELAAQSPTTTGTGTDLPELVYICPMVQDSDVAEEKPGKCRKCGMVLVPARIKQGFTCTSHDAILQEKPGVCPLDRRELVSVAVSVFWSCADSADHLTEPGKCPDGKARVRRLEKRPHADHNPRHGGLLFMADTGWHHVEGTYPSAGLFRVYFYDELTKPMSPKGFVARAVVTDSKGATLETVPMKPGKIVNTLETTLATRDLPLSVQLRVRFKADDKERPFDFTFPALTKDTPAPPPVTTTNTRPPEPAATTASAAKPAPAPPAEKAPEAPPAPPPAPPPADAQQPGAIVGAPTVGALSDGSTIETLSSTIRVPPRLPGTSRELLALLTTHSDEVKSMLEQGMLGALWKPTLDAKDVALGLGDHLGELSDDRRTKASSAVRQLVTSAWQIDAYADLGDKQRVLGAHGNFATAIADLKAAYGSAP